MSHLVPDLQVSTSQMAKGLGLSGEEFEWIEKKLGRKPNFAELGIFSAMFSEHCSYKSSRKYLKRFPTQGKRVLQGPGENAGILDIGGGWAVAFKMESHNHPSFIEPHQGAATGVGGILRDIFTMGARPIALMDSLCFGSPKNDKTASLVKGVVKGIGDYGNSVGVPTVAGQTFFHACYNQNPLVNAFALGIVKKDEIFKGYASGIGNCLVYAGAKTGRDGVHGATMSSKEFSSDEELERPTVQVGDPFTEKLVLEATLEVMRAGLIVGIQDMGAAGLTSSSFEMAARANTGLEIDLDKVPTREKSMSAYELLLSESQERMLLVCTPEKLSRVQDIYAKWDLHAEQIGVVTVGHSVRMSKDGKQVVDLPVEVVTEPPRAERTMMAPSDLKQRWFIDRNRLLSGSIESKFDRHMEAFNFANPTSLVEQFDSMVGNRTEGGTFDDAAVLRLRDIPEKPMRIAMTVDGNPRVTWLWPLEGGKRAVAEAAINLALKGVDPIGITDCLNFASPENPEVMWQFSETIEGISLACEALGLPVISGNVSFYNETDGKPIYPSPMIGMVGISEGRSKLAHTQFHSTALELALIGSPEGGLGGSLFCSQWLQRDCGQPEETDLKSIIRMLNFLSKLRSKRFDYSCHDISDGGLIHSVLEMAFFSRFDCIGAEISIPQETDVDGFLFGESIPRIVLGFDSAEATEVEMLANQAGVKFTPIGIVNDKGTFVLKQGGAKVLEKQMAHLKESWNNRWRCFF
ncbi:MAG: phosphoribosylformylglycinamidine synthase subunit PurL [Proteobacteria bacterium]|nr:phosphoribosylformylglycinamidine synthase subunit PurL [Pseudomonadota bacterium]